MDKPLTQEWTANDVLEISQFSLEGHAVAFREAYQRIADAHKAAIVAEREEWRGKLQESVRVNMLLEKELAAERNVLKAERKFNESTIVELEEQLAAERQANRGLYVESNERYQQVKLLVDALEDLRQRLVPCLGNKTDHEVLRQIDVVLEKVKKLNDNLTNRQERG